ncbi:DUF6232 family protein [Pseudomonas sp. LT1P18]|uniref:DUF6232 family protein n=1 Tax=Pseudomonas arabinosi TaxID=3398357 RepID=UPI0039F108F6
MDKVFLKNGDISITSTRVIVGTKVYLLRNISSFDAKVTSHLEVDIKSQALIRKIIYIVGAIAGALLGIYIGGNILEHSQSSEFLGDLGKAVGGWLGGFVAAMIAAAFFADKVKPKRSYDLYHVIIDASGASVDMFSTRSRDLHDEIVRAMHSAVIEQH